MLNAVVHNFQEQLEYSAQLSDEPAWIAFYKRLWPDMLAAVRIDKNSKFQQWGIDREILLPNGKRFSIDEKKRKKDYGDLLLEEWSVATFDKSSNTVIKGSKIGWTLDPEKRCDYVAYSIPEAGKCFLLPFELTRQTFKQNLEKWKKNKTYYPRVAFNDGYATINCAIPYDIFKIALWQQMHRKFGNTTPLPLQRIETPQLVLFQHG